MAICRSEGSLYFMIGTGLQQMHFVYLVCVTYFVHLMPTFFKNETFSIYIDVEREIHTNG